MQARLPAPEGELVLQALRATSDALRAERIPGEAAGTGPAMERPEDSSAETPGAGRAGERADQVSAETPGGGSAGTRPEDVSAETPDSRPAQRRADALVAMAETVLASGVAPCAGGERHQVVVHIDAEALADDEPGRCELDDGHALAPETARRLACDASVVAMRERGGRPLSVGRKTRSIPPAIRRALTARDRGCRFPGCGHHRFVDGHHITHWAHGGKTSVENLVLLCRHHHRLVHEGGYRLERRSGGRLVFRRPDGRRVSDHPQPCGGTSVAVRERHGRHGPPIDADTAVTGWQGDPLDLGLVTELLLAHHEPCPGPYRPDQLA